MLLWVDIHQLKINYSLLHSNANRKKNCEAFDKKSFTFSVDVCAIYKVGAVYLHKTEVIIRGMLGLRLIADQHRRQKYKITPSGFCHGN